LPTIEELEKVAMMLHKRYSTPAAYGRNREQQGDPANKKNVPSGTPWFAPTPKTKDTPEKAPKKSKGKVRKSKTAGVTAEDKLVQGSASPFRGDMSLAGSIQFMYDAMLSREASCAVAEGDIGRVYEVFKVRRTLCCRKVLIITLI
jgi:hypothetical protein